MISINNRFIIKSKLLIIFVILGILFSCENNDISNNEAGSLTFSMTLNLQDNRISNTNEQTPTALIVSIENATGDNVFYMKTVPLIKLGEVFISNPISFGTGEYKITDYIIIDEKGEALYAVPKEHAPNAGSVTDPLPITFYIEKEIVTNIAPQVIPITGLNPKSFGYETFSFEVVPIYQLLISVFSNKENQFIPVDDAELVIKTGNKELFNGLLTQGTNTIIIPADQIDYTITVKKTGFNTYEKTIPRKELLSYILPNGTPLVILLDKNNNGLIFWNKLGSIDELKNSEVGPGIQLISYKIKDWEEAKIVPGIYGNGLYVNHDIREGWQNDGGNFFAIDNRKIGLSPEKGCLEFWFKFKYDCSTHNHAYFIRTSDSLTSHYATIDNTYDIGNVAIGWNGWDYGSYGKRYFASILTSNLGETFYCESYSSAPGGVLAFYVDQVVHFAYSWDKKGINGSSETFQLYVNGAKQAASTISFDKINELQNFTYIGSTPNYGNWDHFYNAVNGVTDNLKIWNYAKTDFSDRFKE